MHEFFCVFLLVATFLLVSCKGASNIISSTRENRSSGNERKPTCSCTYTASINTLVARSGERFLNHGDEVEGNSVVTFHCLNPGTYRFTGRKLVTCSTDCTWETKHFPTCTPRKGNDIVIYVAPHTGIFPDGTFAVIPGTQVILKCRLQNSKKTRLIWNTPIQSTGTEQEDFDEVTGAYSLSYLIESAKSTDSGLYKCLKDDGESHSISVAVQNVMCEKPQDPVNGRAVYTSLEYNSELQYVCYRGFRPSSYQPRKCMADSQWSGAEPQCQDITCGKPKDPNHGQAFYIELTYGSHVWYECNEGYQISSTKFRICGEDGKWSGYEPFCKAVTCGTPKDPEHGIALYTTFVYGAKATYQCNSGYKLSSNPTRRCGSDGKWTELEPKCIVIRCVKPEDPAHGRALYTTLDINSKVTYQCYAGYRLSSYATKTCGLNGEWIGHEPICEVIRCLEPEDPAHGRALYTTLDINSKITYACYAGYRLSSDATITCGLNGEWDGHKPICEAIRCIEPEDPAHGKALYTTLDINSKVTYQCYAGYRLSSNVTTICGLNGEWVGHKPICEAIRCKKPKDPVHGKAKYTTLEFKSKHTYECEEGYRLSSKVTRACGLDGEWLGNVPDCEVIICERPLNPNNGIAVYLSQKYHSHLTYECDPGHRLSSILPRKCDSNGEWIGNEPLCEVISCDRPGNPQNGKAVITSLEYKSKVTYECDEGFRLSSNTIRACGPNGLWNSTEPFCIAISCDRPGNPKNGRAVFTSQEYNSELAYQCNKAFQISSTEIRLCQSNGLWRGAEPFCKEICEVDVINNGALGRYEKKRFRGIGWRRVFVLVSVDAVLEEGEEAELKCQEGYRPKTGTENDFIIACRNGKLSPKPECISNRCYLKNLPKKEGVDFTDDEFVESNTTPDVACIEGYSLTYPNVYCRNGVWEMENILSPCQEDDCEVSRISHGAIYKENVGSMHRWFGKQTRTKKNYVRAKIGSFENSGTSLFVECQEPYMFEGGQTADQVEIVCRRGGWEPPPRCMIGCTSLKKRKDSDLLIRPEKQFYDIGETITLSCPVGKSLTEKVERMLCIHNHWTPLKIPDCHLNDLNF